MQKTPAIITAILFSILNVTAQKAGFNSSTHLGIQTGINLCYTNFRPAISQQIFTANNTGLVFRHISEPNIGIQFEVNVAQKGWIEKKDSTADYKRVLKTVEFPVTAVFVFGKRTMKLSFQIGPYLSYRRKETESFNVDDSSYFRAYYHKPLENKWEFGLTAGLGVELHSRIGIFSLRGSYFYGLSNIFPLNVPEFYYENSRMQMIHAGIVYMVNL